MTQAAVQTLKKSSTCFNISSFISISPSHPGHYKLPSLLFFSFFLPSKEVCVGGNEKKRKSVKNILFFRSPFHMRDCVFIFTHCNINAILALIAMKKISNEKEWKSVKNILLFRSHFHMTDCVFIFIHCNINAILSLIVMNKIRKELVMITTYYGNQITTNQSTILIILVILILIITRDITSDY